MAAGQVAGGIKGSLRAKLGAEARRPDRPAGWRCPAQSRSAGRQSVLLPRMEAGVLAAESRSGAAGRCFCTSESRESCGPGRMAPPTSSCLALTRHHGDGGVGRDDHQRPGALSARAATAPHSSSAPSWAGLSSRSLMPLFSPGPTVRMRALHRMRKAGQHPACSARAPHCPECRPRSEPGMTPIQRKQIHQPDGVFV